jgi:hypothetical protein
MKPVTVDMLKAHLMVASFTAMGAEVLVCLALLVLPVSQHALSSTPFQVLAFAVIASGVVVTRQLAHAAFELAIRDHHAIPASRVTAMVPPVALASDCPRLWLVILHLRFTGRPFVLAKY